MYAHRLRGAVCRVSFFGISGDCALSTLRKNAGRTMEQPAEAADTMNIESRACAIRSGLPGRDEIADMQWALSTEPPDFLSMVSLVQRVGAPVLSVADETSLRTPLHIAALHGKVAYAAMLISRGAPIEAGDSHNWTPLMASVFGEANGMGLATTRLLLACNANVNACCQLGSTSLHICASYGSLTAARLLIERGAVVDCRDSEDETPLHKAALRGSVDMCRFLCSHGADPRARTKTGLTPLQLAENEGLGEHAEVVEFFRNELGL